MPGGRPTDYKQETCDIICERLIEGQSLRAICLDEDMPAGSTVFKWLNLHQEFAEQYARARETQADVIADEILLISDDGHNDFMEKNHSGTTSWVENGEALRRSQLRVDARKWLAGKMRPKKYGDKLDTTTTHNLGDGVAELFGLISGKTRSL
jgi:hypothetical protein